MVDLVVRDGTLVTDGSMGVADIGIDDGTIVQIGGTLRGRHEVDAQGLYVLPGGIDAHVHLSHPVRPEPGAELWVDDFYSGSLAAIAGGITTIGNMTFQWCGESLRSAVQRDRAAAERDSVIDFILHPVLSDPGEHSVAELPALAVERYGSLKIFMVLGQFDPHVDWYLEAMRVAAREGVLTMIHCEDGALVRCLCKTLIAAGRGAALHYEQSRPDYVEAAATERATAFARATGASIYIVHLSSEAALQRCRQARASGVPVYVETRPLYLHLTRERLAEPDGVKYTGAPPLREDADRRAMWHGLRNGDIQCVCSDHAPWSLRQKLDPAWTIETLPLGVSDLQTMLPMLFSEGVGRGRISLSRFVEVTSTNAAKLFGLYPQKGTIAVGADADLVVWDPNSTRTIDGSTMHSRAGYSVYDGWEVRGWPLYTISRGEIVFARGEIVAERGRGRWIPRRSPASL